MKNLRLVLFLLLATQPSWSLSAGHAPQGSHSPKHLMSASLLESEAGGLSSGGEDDPGYEAYKAGYSLVLDAEWDAARSKFDQLSHCCPESRFIDDAMYWTGYSWLKSGEFEKAIEAYTDMLATYPSSTYYDDAVADLAEAQTQMEIANLQQELSRYQNAPTPLPPLHYQARMQDLEHKLERLTWSYHLPQATPDAEADPETQLRIDALNALGDGVQDDESIATLQEVAKGSANPLVLREQALQLLSQCDASRVLPIFIEIARNDSNTALRTASIDYITSIQADSSVHALIGIFSSIPPGNPEMSARVFYSIAEVGNDEAVDFLAEVARRHDDMTLRREAVYYLGAIGSDRARSALHSILRGK